MANITKVDRETVLIDGAECPTGITAVGAPHRGQLDVCRLTGVPQCEQNFDTVGVTTSGLGMFVPLFEVGTDTLCNIGCGIA